MTKEHAQSTSIQTHTRYANSLLRNSFVFMSMLCTPTDNFASGGLIPWMTYDSKGSSDLCMNQFLVLSGAATRSDVRGCRGLVTGPSLYEGMYLYLFGAADIFLYFVACCLFLLSSSPQATLTLRRLGETRSQLLISTY